MGSPVPYADGAVYGAAAKTTWPQLRHMHHLVGVTLQYLQCIYHLNYFEIYDTNTTTTTTSSTATPDSDTTTSTNTTTTTATTTTTTTTTATTATTFLHF